ncbi:DUF5009 domain-containing protein [Baaleninema simplex]|uniref:DUF5009 domain-containing protein n=1 Tax=Baaleninema simplex TaxID=2862350 RepID=UPI000349A293|nr:DUF5009 domain-containing protein [Baaleninema simplex]
MTRENPVSKRADALDALRGIAVLAMVFSGIIPFGGALPSWMYHAQVPPPEHIFNPDVPGLTWVDWVFPIFLFSMGAAIPLAQSRRHEKGWEWWRIVPSILWRGVSLLAFAVFLQHLRPNILDPALGDLRWWLALSGFLILGLAFGRFPKWVPEIVQKGINVAGWLMGILLLSQLQYPDGTGFSPTRNDIILVVLANVAVVGALVWWLTRRSVAWRLGVMAWVLALLFSYSEPGWVKQVFSMSPLPSLLNFAYWKYLLVVLPGTIVGDGVLRWMKSSQPVPPAEDVVETLQVKPREEGATEWRGWEYGAIALLGITISLILLVGLQARWVWQTTVVTAILGTVLLRLVRSPVDATERLLATCGRWGVYWILLGLALEPYEGGIKKDPATLSYLFVTVGMSALLLAALFVVSDVFCQTWAFGLFVATGRNPLVGYVGYANLLLPILMLTGWRETIEDFTMSPRRGVVRAAVYTLIVALLASGMTRLRWFWKS